MFVLLPNISFNLGEQQNGKQKAGAPIHPANQMKNHTAHQNRFYSCPKIRSGFKAIAMQFKVSRW